MSGSEEQALVFQLVESLVTWHIKVYLKITKTGKKFINKSLMEKINKAKIEVRASFLFSAGLWTARARQIPPRKHSWLSAQSPWKNKADGISKYQTSRNQRGGRSKTNKQFGCGRRRCQGILQRRAKDGGVAVKGKRKNVRGAPWRAEAEMCKSITGQSFSECAHELLKWKECQREKGFRTGAG